MQTMSPDGTPHMMQFLDIRGHLETDASLKRLLPVPAWLYEQNKAGMVGDTCASLYQVQGGSMTCCQSSRMQWTSTVSD